MPGVEFVALAVPGSGLILRHVSEVPLARQACSSPAFVSIWFDEWLL